MGKLRLAEGLSLTGGHGAGQCFGQVDECGQVQGSLLGPFPNFTDQENLSQ